MATWTQCSYEQFIKNSDEGWKRGMRFLHFLGGSSIDVSRSRAIAQTKMTISQRATIDGVECDVVCAGRFYDFLEKRRGRWGLVLRRLAYERDTIKTVDPSATITLDKNLLTQFPEGYKHLAYMQSKLGYPVKRDMPGLEGPELDALYAKGKTWLEGGKI